MRKHAAVAVVTSPLPAVAPTSAPSRNPHIGLSRGCAVKVLWTADVPASLPLAESHVHTRSTDDGFAMSDNAVLRVHHARVDSGSGHIVSTVRPLYCSHVHIDIVDAVDAGDARLMPGHRN